MSNYDKVELLFDFKENEYPKIDEVFKAKVKLDLKDLESLDDSSKSNSTLYWAAGAGTGGAFIGMVISCWCCCCGCKSDDDK